MKRDDMNDLLSQLLESEGEEGSKKTEPVQPGAALQSTVNGKVSKSQIANTLTTLNKLRNGLRKAVYGRDNISNALVFALASNQHMLILGPHGEAKSFLVKKAIEFTQLKGYYTQVHVETSVKDIVGMINPAQALKGNLELIKTKFWDANILYFDEFLRARTEFLDFLLEVLEERTCSKTVLGCQNLPVVSVIATSNPLTDDYNTDDRLDLALKDRFAFIVDIEDHLIASSPAQIERVLSTHKEDINFNGNMKLTPNELIAFNRYAKSNVTVDVSIIRELFDVLKRDKHKFSTRFIKRYKECVQVWALLNKRSVANDKDFLDVANMMLANRFDGLKASEIKKAVGEALSVKEHDAIVKQFNTINKKKGIEFVKEYMKIAETLKNKSEASLPDRILDKRKKAQSKFGVEFHTNWQEIIKHPTLLAKMNTPAFEDQLEELAETCSMRTSIMDKDKAKQFREKIKQLDKKGILHVKSRESVDLDDNGNEVAKERFSIYPKINEPESFQLARNAAKELKDYLLSY